MTKPTDNARRADHTGTRRFSEGVEQLPDTPQNPEQQELSRFRIDDGG